MLSQQVLTDGDKKGDLLELYSLPKGLLVTVDAFNTLSTIETQPCEKLNIYVKANDKSLNLSSYQSGKTSYQ